jgi:hypothetical protein
MQHRVRIWATTGTQAFFERKRPDNANAKHTPVQNSDAEIAPEAEALQTKNLHCMKSDQ